MPYFRLMFSLSDKIVCVNNSNLPDDILACPLILGVKYEVCGLKRCPCGHIFVDVGLSIARERYDVVCACKRRMQDGTWWFDAKRFEFKRAAEWKAVKEVVVYKN